MPPEDLTYIKTVNDTACDCGHAHVGVLRAPSGNTYLVVASPDGKITAVPLENHLELRQIGAMLLDAADEWEIKGRNRKAGLN